MLVVVSTSDTHLGLKTDDIDRNDEIVDILLSTVDRAIENKVKGNDVILILGGDIFNSNTPSERDISDLLTVFNKIKEHDIKTYYLLGNHEAYSDPNRLSCLGFVKKAKVGYPSITLIDDIKFLKIADYDSGPLYFTFLPHISRGTLEKVKRDTPEYRECRSPQDYIDAKCKKILKKVGKGSQHYVFSHLNIKGVHPGSEENLLKKSEVFLPNCFSNTPVGYVTPTVIQYHIHTNQEIDNIHVIGSPIFCGFGEQGPKYFCEIKIKDQLGQRDNIELIRTKYRPFHQLELNMIGETRDFFDIPELEEFWKVLSADLDRKPVAKINVKINAENNNYNWDEIRKKIMRLLDGVYLKPINPERVSSNRETRSKDQKIALTPSEAIKVYLTRHVSGDDAKEKKKRIYNKSKKYWEV